MCIPHRRLQQRPRFIHCPEQALNNNSRGSPCNTCLGRALATCTLLLFVYTRRFCGLEGLQDSLRYVVQVLLSVRFYCPLIWCSRSQGLRIIRELLRTVANRLGVWNDERQYAFIQSAVPYTTATGQKMMRTCNITLPVVSLAVNVSRYADADVTTAYWFRIGEYLWLLGGVLKAWALTAGPQQRYPRYRPRGYGICGMI